MEMDRQTIMVLFAAIIGLTLFGTAYLAPSKHETSPRPQYAADDIRHKYQVEDAKKKKQKPAAVKVSAAPDPEPSENEEPSLDDQEPQEAPAIE